MRCTDPDATPEHILAWFVPRWQPEVTFEESRRCLGAEVQRQWSDLAIQRITPALFGLFSLVTLHVHQKADQAPTPVRPAAWYPKTKPTFADALALVRRELWVDEGFSLSAHDPEVVQLQRRFGDHLTEMLSYAA